MISLSPIKKKKNGIVKKKRKGKNTTFSAVPSVPLVCSIKQGKKSIRHLHIVASCFLNID